VEIHKQVEAELAKRSHFCQKLIKKLSGRVQELEEELDHSKLGGNTTTENNNNKTNPDQVGNTSRHVKKETYIQEDRNKDELISFLEKNLENAEKRLAKLHNDYDILKNDYSYLESKLENANRKYGNLSSLLKDNLDMVLKGKPLDIDPNNRAVKKLDLNELKDKSLDELNSNQKETLLIILLEQAKPFLSRENLETRLRHVELVDSNSPNRSIEDLNLPKINERMSQSSTETKIEQNKFHGVPLEISTKIVRSNLRDWGKPVATIQNSKNPRLKYRVDGGK